MYLSLAFTPSAQYASYVLMSYLTLLDPIMQFIFFFYLLKVRCTLKSVQLMFPLPPIMSIMHPILKARRKVIALLVYGKYIHISVRFYSNHFIGLQCLFYIHACGNSAHSPRTSLNATFFLKPPGLISCSPIF